MNGLSYAILAHKRTVAHLCDGPFSPPLCGRGANLTSNTPGGRRTCKDCWRIATSIHSRNQEGE